MAYSYRWQYCDMDFLRHCLKKYSLLLEKIPSAILTEETTGTQMFVTEFLSDCIKRCDDGFDDYTMTALLPEGAATVTLQENRDTVRRLSTRYHGEYAALLPEMAAYYFSKAGRQQRRDTEQALGKRCFAFFDYAYNRMLEAQFLRHDFRWVGGEIPSVNHLKTLSDAADLTEALGQFRREEYDRRKEHDFSHAKLCTFLETRFGMLYFENRFAAYLLQPVSGGFPQMTAARKAGCCGDAVGCWAALPSRQSEKCAACLELMKTNGSRCWRHTFVSAGKGDPLFRRDTAVPAGICRAAGKGFPAMEVGVRQGHATAAASHSRPTAAMCPGTRHRLVLAAGNTAGIHRAAPGKRGIGSTAPAGTGCLFRTGGTVPAKNGSCFR